MDRQGPAEDPLDNTCNLTLILTRACQLACAYCRMNRDPGAVMEEPVLRRAVDLLMAGPSPQVALDFSGGEPLLRFDLLRRGLLYAEEAAKAKAKRLRLDLSTNSLLLDERKAGFLIEHGARIHVSSDGSLATHRRNRPPVSGPSSAAASRCRQSMRLLARLGVQFDATMVVFPKDVRSMVGNAGALMDAGASVVQMDCALGMLWSREEASGFAEGLAAAALEARRRRAKGARVAVESSCFGNPDINSVLMAIETDGTILMGCTPTIERECPGLAKLLRFGSVRARKSLEGLRRTPSELARFILDRMGPGRERALYVNNMVVGLSTRKALAHRGLAPLPGRAATGTASGPARPSRPGPWAGKNAERWILAELACLEAQAGDMPGRGAWDGSGEEEKAGLR
ncbi:MAG: radical SAM protein [Elusimicrobia bacterium]|nr:radical SAM protein [Elusimicrobiota bacterium]